MPITKARIVPVAAAAAVLAISVFAVFWLHRDEASAANPGQLKSEIDGKISALNPPSRTVELPTEKARRVRSAIDEGDYAAADKIFAGVLADSRIESWRFYPFTDFIDGIADIDNPAFETGLDTWVEKDGNDAAALLIRARFYFDVAWEKRGHDYTGDTAAEKLDAFQSYIDKALADCEAALRLDPANPYTLYLRFRILSSLGGSQRMVQAFQEAVARYPGYYPLYTMMLDRLQPKWGGSVPAMYAFVDRYAGGAGETAPLKLLYVDLYRSLLETAMASCDSGHLAGDKLAECVSSAMRKIVTPELESAIPAAMKLYDHSDKYQFGLALGSILSKMLKWAGGQTHAGALLEIAAVAMHSSTQLKPDNPVANSYVIDKLVAESWYSKSFFDNALKKAREALEDVDATTFPSEAEKDFAIAGILEYAGVASGYLGQATDAIAYEEAMISLGDRADYEQYVC